MAYLQRPHHSCLESNVVSEPSPGQTIHDMPTSSPADIHIGNTREGGSTSMICQMTRHCLTNEVVVIFRLTNTLLDNSYCLFAATLAVIQHDTRFSITTELLDHMVPRMMSARIECHRRSASNGWNQERLSRAVFRSFYYKCGLSWPKSRDLEAVIKLFNDTYEASLKASDGSIHAMLALKQLGYVIILAFDDHDPELERRAEAIRVLQLADYTMTVRCGDFMTIELYPHVCMFAPLGVLTERCVLISNDMTTDIRGALCAGMQAVHYDPASSRRQVWYAGTTVPVIRSMTELWRQAPPKTALPTDDCLCNPDGDRGGECFCPV